MSKRKKKSKLQKKLKKSIKKYTSNKAAVVITAIVFLVVLFIGTFFLTTAVFDAAYKEPETESVVSDEKTTENKTAEQTQEQTTPVNETTTDQQMTTTERPSSPQNNYTPGNTDYPSDTASWQLICVNKDRYVASDVEDAIKLSYVSGSGERMDSRAAAAYEIMYDAAAADGYYLTPCSGYRSYSTQKRLYFEFVNDYLNDGYSENEAHDLASKRRNPPGSSEHNLGICMDIICAASSANFQNTEEYAWLCENAADYGFILRYPEDKVSVTGVKFEPWHWRYVGKENAERIKASGLCLEEYLGLA